MSHIKAMMMSAGLGTRLYPLTSKYPKPLVPIVNKPVIDYALDNARRHGVREIAVNLYHCPHYVQSHLGDGSRWGLRLHYSVEKRLWGTAGGVKRFEKFFSDGTFVVLSGDGLSEIDLADVVAFHRSHRSFATMVLKPVTSRFEYGVTLVNRKNRIVRFIEKPKWEDVFSNTVNTGVYVFEPGIFRYIPSGRECDFAQNVWPRLLKERKPIFGYVTQDYWRDVGNLAEYRQAHRDVLDGRMKYPSIAGQEVKPSVWVGENVRIDKRVQLQGPCVIGDHCVIGRGSVIGPYTTIGDHVRIGPSSTVRGGVVWNKAVISNGAYLNDCIVGYDSKVAKNSSSLFSVIIRRQEL
ncbi:MAG TPA: NDP-sugar synthase [Elusimicrobiota bacterium]|nr:NDP-sugar synthase [Elusimicrobiota bacterium]